MELFAWVSIHSSTYFRKKTIESKYLPKTLFHLENVLKQAELVKQNILFLSQD